MLKPGRAIALRNAGRVVSQLPARLFESVLAMNRLMVPEKALWSSSFHSRRLERYADFGRDHHGLLWRVAEILLQIRLEKKAYLKHCPELPFRGESAMTGWKKYKKALADRRR